MRMWMWSVCLMACGTTDTTGFEVDDAWSTRLQGLVSTQGPCAGQRAIEESSYLFLQDSAQGRVEPCTTLRHASAGPEGARISVQLTDWGRGRAQMTLRRPDGRVLQQGELRRGEALEVQLPISGEYLIDLAPVVQRRSATSYGIDTTCLSNCDGAYTRYPLVMMHGAAGTDTYLGILDYWFGIEQPMVDAGYDIHIGAVDALAGVASRGVQWASFIDEVLASTGARRVNLIGHSQGGLDARYVVSGLGYGDRVGSVTTVATPHRGTVSADLAAGVIGLGPFDGAILDAVVGSIIGIVGLQGDDLTLQLQDLTRDGAAGFNLAYPDDPDVIYRSWAGRSCRLLDLFCQWDNDGEIVTPALSATYELTAWNEGPNDGLVSVATARWGEYQGELPADHMDEVGQILDLFDGPFDHVQFYLDEGARLHTRGL